MQEVEQNISKKKQNKTKHKQQNVKNKLVPSSQTLTQQHQPPPLNFRREKKKISLLFTLSRTHNQPLASFRLLLLFKKKKERLSSIRRHGFGHIGDLDQKDPQVRGAGISTFSESNAIGRRTSHHTWQTKFFFFNLGLGK